MRVMDKFQKFYDRTLRFLSFRPRSEKEIVSFLKKPHGRKKERLDDQTIAKIIKKLKEQNFINDEEFAKWWIEQRQGSKPRGKRIIIMELKQKGIAEFIIQNSEFIIQKQDELAKKALERIAGRYQKLPRHEAYRKMSEFLLRRGFDWEAIKSGVDEVLRK